MKMSKKWLSIMLVGALSIGLIVPVSAEEQVNKLQTKATVTIIDGELEFGDVTPEIKFEDIKFSFEEDGMAVSEGDIVLEIMDNRSVADSHVWNLQAGLTASEGFEGIGIQATGGGATNESGFSGFDVNELNLTVGGGSVLVSTVIRTDGQTTGQGAWTITYPKENIILTVPQEKLHQLGPNEVGRIIWTLSDTPIN